jgi:hypothetical protein
MSDAPRQPPPKKEVALALLQESSMFVHLDPRRADVLVPKWFMGQPQLVLQVGLNMAIPIPDLAVDEDGISCTLSFNRAPFWCRLPWTAVYALVGEDGRGGVWPEDVPPEIQLQKQGAPPTKQTGAKKPRPKLAAVGARSRPAAASEAPSRRGRARDEVKDEPEKEAEEAEAAPPPAAAGDEPALTPVPSTPTSPSGKKPKREIPPYLRVIK